VPHGTDHHLCPRQKRAHRTMASTRSAIPVACAPDQSGNPYEVGIVNHPMQHCAPILGVSRVVCVPGRSYSAFAVAEDDRQCPRHFGSGFSPCPSPCFLHIFRHCGVPLLRVFSDRLVGGDRVRIEASDMGRMSTIKALDQQLGGLKIAGNKVESSRANLSSSDLFIGVWGMTS
jgi:hypothetical protein